MNKIESRLSVLNEKSLINVWDDISYAILISKADKNLYLRYKDDERIKNNEFIDELSEYQLKEINTINLLENFGFSTDDIGTYLYKEVIMSVDENNDEDIIAQLRNKYSSFYQQIAREYYEMGVSTFHSFICAAIDNIDSDSRDEELSRMVFGSKRNSADYGTQAYVIASYMKNEKKVNSKTKRVAV